MRSCATSKLGKYVVAVLATSLSVMLAPESVRGQISLTDANSQVDITTNSYAGMHNWTIDGTDVLAQQWFWYRVGNVGGQFSLDTLPATYNLLAPSILKASFTGATFVVTMTLNLSGGSVGSGNSDLSLQFKIQNTGSTNLNFHFFEYSNFDLGGVPGDSVSFLNSNTVAQTGSVGSLLETVATGASGFLAPMHHEANLLPNTLNSLTSGSTYFLNDTNSAGPGDVTWAYEWDVNVAPGSSTQISKDINLQIPEPGTFALVFLGISGLWVLRKRRV